MAFSSSDILNIFQELGITTQVRTDQPLIEQGIDSIDLPRAAAALEKKFGIDLSDAKCEQLKTIDLMTEFIRTKI